MMDLHIDINDLWDITAIPAKYLQPVIPQIPG